MPTTVSELKKISDRKKIVVIVVIFFIVAMGVFTYFSMEDSSPDFTIAEIRTQKDEVQMGEITEGVIRIKNIGGEKGRFTVNLGETSKSIVIPAGEEGEITIRLNSDVPGIHEVKLENAAKKYLVYRPFPFLGAKVKYTASGELGGHPIIGSLTYEIVEVSNNSYSAKVSPTGTLRTFIENGTKIYGKGDPFDWGMAINEGELIDEIDVKTQIRNVKILHYRQQVRDENIIENIGLYVPEKTNVPIAFYRETSSGSIHYAMTETNLSYLKFKSENKELENVIK